MRKPLSLIVLLGLSAAAFGQTAPPALMVKVDGKSQPLGLTKLDTNVRIYGYLAETTTTMTFFNSLDRVMEGDLYFPLPEGSTISGYALDIEGKMIDGVAVEKDKGRQVFEKIVRQGIDPGLIEWTKGNNFKTRVFPIPAKGTRTIRVSYVSEIVGGGGGAPRVYRLPLKFKDKVREFTIKMEVVKPLAVPTVQQGGLAGFGFEKWRDSYVAETKLEDADLDQDLFIALPGVEKLDVLIERADDGQTYFAVHDYPELPQLNGNREMPRHVVVYWDASGSRGATDHSREIELLGKCLGSLLPQDRKSQGFTVDLVVFRNAAAEPKRFRWTNRNDRGPNGNDALLKSIETLPYDGGTQMSAITPPKGAPQPDLCLLFTDGLSNFGREKPSRLQAPLYAFSMDAAVNHNFLKQLAAATGGRYFNLNRMTNDEVLAVFGKPTYSFLGAEADSAAVEEPYPRLPQPVTGRFTLVGRLVGDRATVALNYGYAGVTRTAQRTVTVSQTDAVEGTLLKRLWAQTKLAELLIAPKRNEEEIVSLGKKHGLVTPHTSLIVLDSLEQYIEHRIPPPRSLPKMLHEYNQAVDTIAAQKKQEQRDKLKAVVAMWNERVAWWEKEFKYPKDFRYREKEAAKSDTGDDNNVMPAPNAREAPASRPSTPGNSGAAPPDLSDNAAAEEMSEDQQLGEQGQFQAFGGGLNDSKANGKRPSRQAGIAVTPWDPKTPYVAELKAAKYDADALAVYLKNRGEYGDSPAFYLDCADFFQQRDSALALQILSNVAEMELENAQLLRVLGHRLTQLGQYALAIRTFEEVLGLRPEEPQSYRDLALVLIRRADSAAAAMKEKRMPAEAAEKLNERIAADYARALDLLNEVVLGHWDRFDQIEAIALIEANRIIPRAKALGVEIPIDKRLIKQLDYDVRITMTWHADMTDIDLHVIEPSGEQAYYSHNRTTIGGAVSRDFTQGYGPEEYVLRRAMNGHYIVKAKYYGSQSTRLLGAVTIQLDVVTNYGRENEQRQSVTRRLKDVKEMVEIGKIEF